MSWRGGGDTRAGVFDDNGTSKRLVRMDQEIVRLRKLLKECLDTLPDDVPDLAERVKAELMGIPSS